jgi:hypothetical protein
LTVWNSVRKQLAQTGRLAPTLSREFARTLFALLSNRF